MKTKFLKFILVSCFILGIQDIQAQIQTYNASKDSYILVKGTSTLHDWEMKSENVISEVQFKMNEKGHLENLESLKFSINKTTLKSTQSALDKKAYDALKASKYPEIVFKMNGNSSVKPNGNNYDAILKGELIIAGITRQISLNATCTNGDDKKMICSGTQHLKMTDFKIEPPVMMLGALRTADEITIDYKMVYTR